MGITTGNLILRSVRDDDINEVARMWNFEKGEISSIDAKKAIDWMNENHQKNNEGPFFHLCFAIFEVNSARIIGWCGLDGRDNKRVHLFYLIDEAYRRKGYATTCARKVIEYGFTKLFINRIDGQCDKDNIGSKGVLENTVAFLETAGQTHKSYMAEHTYLSISHIKNKNP